jgi:hypothetical protein
VSAPRVLVLGDGAAGLAVAALLPGALVLPSEAPAVRVANDSVPYGAGPRYLFPSPGSEALFRRAGEPVPRLRRLAFGYREGDVLTPAPDAGEALRSAYGRKLHAGTPPPSSGLAASGGRGAELDVYDASFGDLVRALRGVLLREGRILPYEPLDPDPDPDAPLRTSSGVFDAVLYTVPPAAVWRGLRAGVALDKAFLPVRPGPAADPSAAGWEYVMRPGADVPWHREAAVRGRGGDPAVVLEWTLPDGGDRAADLPAAADAAVRAGLEALAPPALFRGLQVVRPGSPVPRGRCWAPMGRIAEWDPSALLADVADAAVQMGAAWT